MQKETIHLDVYRDPWIDAKLLDGCEEKLSLRDCLEKANSIKSLSINDAHFDLDSTVPYTLLTIILGRVFAPSRDNKLDMLENGKFDLAAVDEYIASCESKGISFDVFDSKRPFLQDPEIRKEAKFSTVGILDPLMVSGNNTVFYHNRNYNTCGMAVEDTLSMSPECFIASVARNHMYHNASGQGCATGYSPSQPPLHGLLHGKNLHETLVLSIPNNLYGIPLWERPYNMTVPELTQRCGNLDYISAAFLPTTSIRFNEISQGKVKSILYCGNIYKEPGREKQKPKEFTSQFYSKGNTGFNLFLRKVKVKKEETILPLTMNTSGGDFTPTILQLMQNYGSIGDQEFITEALDEELLNGPIRLVVYGGILSSNSDEPQTMCFDMDLLPEMLDLDTAQYIKNIASFIKAASENLRYCLLGLEQETQHGAPNESGAVKTIVRHFTEYACDQLVPKTNLHDTWIERIASQPTKMVQQEIFDEIQIWAKSVFRSYRTNHILLASKYMRILDSMLKKAAEN